MIIAAISDLHLGGKDQLDRFHRVEHTQARLLELLDELERTVDQIVLLGDIFETLRGRLPGTRREELTKAINAYPELSKRFLDDPRYLLVQGNHDFISRDALGAREHYSVSCGDTEVLFFHGHQLTWLERGEARLSRFGVWCGGLLERGGVPINEWSDQHRGLPSGTKARKLLRFEQAAVDHGRARRADIVVTGHTHHLNKKEIGASLYLNTGTCLGASPQWVLIDTERKTFTAQRRKSRPVASG